MKDILCSSTITSNPCEPCLQSVDSFIKNDCISKQKNHEFCHKSFNLWKMFFEPQLSPPSHVSHAFNLHRPILKTSSVKNKPRKFQWNFSDFFFVKFFSWNFDGFLVTPFLKFEISIGKLLIENPPNDSVPSDSAGRPFPFVRCPGRHFLRPSHVVQEIEIWEMLLGTQIFFCQVFT